MQFYAQQTFDYDGCPFEVVNDPSAMLLYCLFKEKWTDDVAETYGPIPGAEPFKVPARNAKFHLTIQKIASSVKCVDFACVSIAGMSGTA